MSEFSAKPVHIRIGEEEEEDKNSHETMDDEENRKRAFRYQKHDSDPSLRAGTSPEASEDIQQYFSDSDDSKRPLMEKVLCSIFILIRSTFVDLNQRHLDATL